MLQRHCPIFSRCCKFGDISCRMTNNKIGCDVAHLCPSRGMSWFTFNDMDQYVSQQFRTGNPAIDDSANALRVSADFHRAFDRLQYIFIPKPNDVLVTPVLVSTLGLRNLYHSATLHQVSAGLQFSFALFALAIFPLLPGFLQRDQRRLLKLAARGTIG